ncbi:uncharacterized protein LOC108035118 [Drosophila biarmipes]|uniref:uncharacterized protein LOC108035118 n=1 Tax=Drosophila biarmipes TaxID=125945 RepID=UPI0007E7968D|nr:uncharacterized protein LOC108035118 [Drosophila biarmipes]
MRYLMVLVLFAFLAMAFVNAIPNPNPKGEVLVVINQNRPDWPTTEWTTAAG